MQKGRLRRAIHNMYVHVKEKAGFLATEIIILFNNDLSVFRTGHLATGDHQIYLLN